MRKTPGHELACLVTARGATAVSAAAFPSLSATSRERVPGNSGSGDDRSRSPMRAVEGRAICGQHHMVGSRGPHHGIDALRQVTGKGRIVDEQTNLGVDTQRALVKVP